MTTSEPVDNFMVDVMRTFKSAPGCKITCRCCKKEYERGDWDFYNLCNPCFKEFDHERMFGKDRLSKYVYNQKDDIAMLFIKTGKCTHGAGDVDDGGAPT